MTSRAFEAETPRHLLARAAYEVQKLDEMILAGFTTEDEAKLAIGSLASACAGTLWNLCDWLGNSNDPDIQAALASIGVKTVRELQIYVRDRSPELTLCWELTNKSKHLKLTGFLATQSQVSDMMVSVPSSLPPSSPRQGLPAIPTIKAYSVIPKVKTDAGANLRVVDVYRGALAYWQQFFTKLVL
jgi:hypothetical protein